MLPVDFAITRKEYILIAKRRSIKEPHKMSTGALKKALNVEEYLYGKDCDIIAKNRGIKEPHKMSNKDLINALNALCRQNIKRKSYSIRRKFRKLGLNKYIKKQNISESDFYKATKLQKLLLDGLKKIANLRRIKDYDNLSKENLIYTILKSEKNLLEDKYTEYLNNNADDEIKTKIGNIRIALIKFGNIINKRDTDKIKKQLYEIEKKEKTQKNPKRKDP